jgi:hypothetical protein
MGSEWVSRMDAKSNGIFLHVRSGTVIHQRLNKTCQFPAFLQPDHGARGGPQIADHPPAVDDQGGGALNENGGFFQSVTVVNAALGIRQNWEWQMQDPGILPGFFNGFPQDQKDLTIGCLEIFIQPAQLAGMTPALQSDILPNKEQDDILAGSKISQLDFSPVTGGQGEFGRHRIDF